MPVPNPFRKPWAALALLAAVFAVGSAATFCSWWLHGRPIDLPPAPLEGLVDGRLACVSYAPYRDGQSPMTPDFRVFPEQIDEDLRILARHTACVRTYSTGQGLAALPEIARKHGLKVLLGAWIGKDAEMNDREVNAAIQLANANPDVVTTVIVGNEVLLRHDQPPERIAEYLRKVKAAVRVPVTYADVWEFWIDATALGRDVDYVTVHLLPYWEGEPMAVPRALTHVRDVLHKVQATFPDRKIFVGEVGWPSLGRMREDARASPSEQTRFIRGFVALSHEVGVGYNFIEAFDQKWKRASEGTVGGHWGLFESNRKPKVELAGDVSDDPRWPVHWWVATGLGALVLAAAMAGRPLPSGRGTWLAAAAVLAAAAGTGLEAQAIYITETVKNVVHWITGGAGFLISATIAVTATGALLDRAHPGVTGRGRASKHVMDALRAGRIEPSRTLLVGVLEMIVLTVALAAALAILFDGRQRDFPTFVYLVPALSFAALWMCCEPVAADRNPIAHILAAALALTAVLTIYNEHLRNTQALGWSMVALMLAMPRLVEAVRLIPVPWRAAVAKAKSKTPPIDAKTAS